MNTQHAIQLEHCKPLMSDTLLYHTAIQLPNAVQTFASCLDLATWRDHLHPFAVACLNAQTNEAVLVRDHLGMEPLYYCHYLGKQLFVAQTIPELLKQLPSTPPLLESQIDMLFSHYKYYSDETLYQGIYRVEPGHLMHFKADGTVLKRPYWKLDANGEYLQYKDKSDYFEHFSSLMDEAILHATQNHTNLAAEFSAGLDSSAIYCAAAKHRLSPKLYMHISLPGSQASEQYVADYENAFIKYFKLNDIQRIGADGFDPIDIFDTYAEWFAGPAPYLFPMFVSNVHRAVAEGKHPILLSGFGGDQCVSGVMPLNFVVPELIQQRQYGEAWQALGTANPLKKIIRYAQYTHPQIYKRAIQLKRTRNRVTNIVRSKARYRNPEFHPYTVMYCRSAREAECELIQGAHSHEVRMRIEYSAIVSKKFGFEYRYPLLYPKLLEFVASLPADIKRYDGSGRYLIRQYLAKAIPGDIFKAYKKKQGLAIVSSTFDHFTKNYHEGTYQTFFKDLPYPHLVAHEAKQIEVRNAIKGYMLKTVAA
ncbi:MAG: asparagine synthase-related protein [Legionellaceae bacterium]|nr:asparagine synthase-related protein [Legionellaceae bacterium]